jgi:hypothetical protein
VRRPATLSVSFLTTLEGPTLGIAIPSALTGNNPYTNYGNSNYPYQLHCFVDITNWRARHITINLTAEQARGVNKFYGNDDFLVSGKVKITLCATAAPGISMPCNLEIAVESTSFENKSK